MNVLIIGAARGIGAALAETIGQQANFQIIKTSRSYGDLSQNSSGQWELHCDVTDTASIERMKTTIEQNFECIDWLINCAGELHSSTFMPEKSIKAVNRFQLQSNYETNAVSHLMVIQALENLINTKSGALIASISARIGSIEDNHLGGWYAYRMSKTALNMGIKTLAIEWSRKHPLVKFLLLHPGTTDTDLSAPFQKNLPNGQLQTAQQTAQLLWTQLHNNQNHDSRYPLYLDHHGKTIPW